MLRFMTNRAQAFTRPLTRVVSKAPASELSSLIPKPENFQQSYTGNKTIPPFLERKHAYLLLGAGLVLASKTYQEREKQKHYSFVPVPIESFSVPKTIINKIFGIQDVLCEQESSEISREDFEKISLLAEQGDVRAQFILGSIYEEGLDIVKQDAVTAKEWYLKSANQGNAYAQYKLGEMNEKGIGMESKDEQTALSWYLKSANQGNSDAQYKLGTMYEKGIGMESKDEQTALSWYLKSANQGNADAQYKLGTMYEEGIGMESKDEQTALSWYLKSANQGNADAQFHLAKLCEESFREIINPEHIQKWYEAAEKQLDKLPNSLQGVVLFKNKKIPEAVKVFRKSLTFYNNVMAYFSFFIFLREQFNFPEQRNDVKQVLDELIKREKNPEIIKYCKFEKAYFLLLEQKDTENEEVARALLYEAFYGVLKTKISGLKQPDKYVEANINLMKKEIQARKIILETKHHISMLNWVGHNDYAYLSISVYDDHDGNKKNTLDNNSYNKKYYEFGKSWEKYKDSSSILSKDHRHGYYGVAYINHAAQEIIIAHKGTTFSFSKLREVLKILLTDIGGENTKNIYGDFFTDMLFAFLGYPNEHFLAAGQFCEHIWDEIDADPVLKTYARSHTGHSLGALLASATAYEDAHVKNKVSTAVTFDSPGTGHVFQHMYGAIAQPPLLYITNYVAEPNYINTLSFHTGTLLRIYPHKYRQILEPLVPVIPGVGIPLFDVTFFSAALGYAVCEFLRLSLPGLNNTLLHKAFKSFLHSSLIPAFCTGLGVWAMAKYQNAEEKSNSLANLTAITYFCSAGFFKISGRLCFPGGSFLRELFHRNPDNFKQWTRAYGRLFKGGVIVGFSSFFAAQIAGVGSELWVELTHLLNSHDKTRLFTVFEREASGDIIRAQQEVTAWPGGERNLLKSFLVAYQANKVAQQTDTLDLDDVEKLGQTNKETGKNSIFYHKNLLLRLLHYQAKEVDRYVLPLNTFSPEAQQFLKEYQENSDAALKKYPMFNDHKALLTLCRIEKTQNSNDALKEELTVHLVQRMKKAEFEEIKQAKGIKIRYPSSINKDNAEIEISYAFTIHEFKDWINRQCARFAPRAAPVPVLSQDKKPSL